MFEVRCTRYFSDILSRARSSCCGVYVFRWYLVLWLGCFICMMCLFCIEI